MRNSSLFWKISYMEDELKSLRGDVSQLLVHVAVADKHREQHENNINVKFSTLIELVKETRTDQKIYIEKLHSLPGSVPAVQAIADISSAALKTASEAMALAEANKKVVDRIDGWVQKAAWVVILAVMAAVIAVIIPGTGV